MLSNFLRVSAPFRAAASRGLLTAGGQAAPRIDQEGIPPPPVTQLSEEELALRDTIRRFSNDVIKPLVAQMDAKSLMDQKVIDGTFLNGLMGVEIPAKYDGPESSFFSTVLILEELARVDPSVSIFVAIQNTLVAPLITAYGTEEQKNKYLTRMHKDWVASFALTEESSGSDAFALKTVAQKDGDDYLISGSKMWITNSENAQFFLVFANVDHSKGYKGITGFLVDKGTNGLSVGKPEDKLGIRASSTCPVHFDSVRVPKSSILGEIGKGYKMAIECLNGGRVGIGAQMLGLAEGCFDNTVPYLQQRKQFGSRLLDFQSVQHQVADMASEIEAARVLVYNAARLRESNLPYIKEASIAKLYASNVATKVSSTCVELMGGVGFTKNFPIEKYYRDCKIGTIYEGASNIQKNTIAKLINSEFQ